MNDHRSQGVEVGPTSMHGLIPRHSYSDELENGKNPFAVHFGELTDDEWLALLHRSITERSIDGVEFPAFPESELQSRIHGQDGELAITEAFQFYRYCRDNTYAAAGSAGSLRLLDFGSGWGRISRAFMRDFAAGNMYGYEPNLLFCSIARGLNPHVCFLHGGRSAADDLPRDWFDVVVGWSVFSHLPENVARAWLSEINRSMRPGGWCVMTTWGDRFLKDLQLDEAKMLSGEPIHWYHELVIERAGGLAERVQEFESGEFVFLGNDQDAYGDTFVSEAALRRMLAEEALDFELIRFDAVSLRQDTFILRRSG